MYYQVILMGGSAGAMGTEANCDLFAGQKTFFSQPKEDKICYMYIVRTCVYMKERSTYFMCNTFFFTDRLHSERADMDVRCISDSGSLYPFQDHTQFCFPQLLEYAASQVDSCTDKYEAQDSYT